MQLLKVFSPFFDKIFIIPLQIRHIVEVYLGSIVSKIEIVASPYN